MEAVKVIPAAVAPLHAVPLLAAHLRAAPLHAAHLRAAPLHVVPLLGKAPPCGRGTRPPPPNHQCLYMH
ncbi:unnamed protein product [Orchesella dallaii]|uniref:Secreted protein n=1 Tax=Orchesella dallaii TaxID=48710 RepID=A0ABP1PPG5_9HEXA